MRSEVTPTHLTELLALDLPGVPLHDHIRAGTLCGIAEDPGIKDYDRFYWWINWNR